MFEKFCIIFAVTFANTSFAQTDEYAIRSEALGIYQSPSWSNGSVTGLGSDRIILRDAAGVQLDSVRTIADWMALVQLPNSPIEQIVRHSDGKTTIRFRYNILSQMFNRLPGGTVEIIRGSQLIDRDRIVK